eukprot:scaffold73908_cov35-Tisochrysis_lutea.AAC.6
MQAQHSHTPHDLEPSWAGTPRRLDLGSHALALASQPVAQTSPPTNLMIGRHGGGARSSQPTFISRGQTIPTSHAREATNPRPLSKREESPKQTLKRPVWRPHSE